ncbi:MAG: hypothetical protein ABIP29_04190 [Candidatus Eisenbacteria bacterium]
MSATGHGAANGRALVLAIALGLSGLGDAIGGLWGVFDWAGLSGFMAGAIPDWQPIGRAARRGLEDEALRQLWANLGSALVALGAAQGMAAWWVRQGRPEGFALARVIAGTLVVAAGLMAGPGGQLSSLATEGARGAAIWLLAAWAAPRDR